MPLARYLNMYIGGRRVDLEESEDLPVSISYRLEDPENFQKKKSSDALDITVPANPTNDEIANTFHNPGVEDMTEEQEYQRFRPAVIEANGYELLVGKALLTNARHHSCPLSYKFDFYGTNADWLIDLKETTLYDFLKHITFDFTKEVIEDSWDFDGTDEDLPYVFAPVRYGLQLDDWHDGGDTVKDANMKPEYMKPSLSIYWIIYWAFKSIGYRVSSQFFNSDYFRRKVIPWTFGNFLFSDGTRLNDLDFLAKGIEWVSKINESASGFWDVLASNDSINGGFDNNGVYEYDAPEMKWTYLPAFNYGNLLATFHFAQSLQMTVTANSDAEVRIQWFKNGVKLDNGNDNGNGTLLMELNAPTIGRRDFYGIVEDWLTVPVAPNDIISAKIYIHTFNSVQGRVSVWGIVEAFELDYIRIPLGGLIDFQTYTGLKKYKFLDFLAGVVDLFNISPVTDTINKVVLMEPTHPYSTTNDLSAPTGGHFNGKMLDWSGKQDLSVILDLELYNESERVLEYKLKEDNNDGLLKVITDRSASIPALAKYVFSDRFKAGKREVPNRFFSATVHLELEQWKGLGSDAEASPQIVCLVPENISNTSREESQNTFEPKICHYKGKVDHVGWVFDSEELDEFPFMFSVNYQTGGQNDPILSYCDERIGLEGEYVIGKGLLRRFYLQRMAIMRHGRVYNTFFKLNNSDVTNWFHREHIICRGQKWELVEINDYKPLTEESTKVYMRKWAPVSLADSNSVYPLQDTILNSTNPAGQFDHKYNPLKCLPSDLQVNR